MLVGWKGISAAMILSASTAGIAQAQSSNQATADAVANALRASRSLAGFRIEIETTDGLATLTGVVASPAQKAEAVARAQAATGVTGVVDHLTVATTTEGVQPAQYQVAHGGGGLFHQGAVGNLVNGGFADGTVPPDAAGMVAGAGTGAGAGVGAADAAGLAGDPNAPLPEGPAVMEGAMRTTTARYPNYAWPSYAPYPNFSAVGYPLTYPWQAWPNIGPFYPYPEPPLDWRAVTANYKHGVWYLKFRRNYTRPFYFVWPFADVFNRNY